MDKPCSSRAQAIQSIRGSDPKVARTIYMQRVNHIVGNTGRVTFGMEETIKLNRIWFKSVESAFRAHPQYIIFIFRNGSDMRIANRVGVIWVALVRHKHAVSGIEATNSACCCADPNSLEVILVNGRDIFHGTSILLRRRVMCKAIVVWFE